MKKMLLIGTLLNFSQLAFAAGPGIKLQYIHSEGVLNGYQLSSLPTLESELANHKTLRNYSLSEIYNEILENEGVKVENLTLDDQIDLVSQYLNSEYNFQMRQDVLSYNVVKQNLILATDQTKLNKVFSNGKNILNFDEKILLAKEMGNLYLFDYNYQRADEGIDSKGVVTLEQLNHSLNTSQKGGVCRDIAVGQAQILKGLGVDNAYVVAFETVDGGHATLVVEDANNPGQLIHLNYGELTSTTYKGANGLRQNTQLPDTGLFFRVFDAEGEPVANIPSELGQVLIEMTGGSLNDIDPGLDRINANIAQAYYDGSNYSIRAFSSEGETGDTNTGVGINTGIGNKVNGLYYLDFGTSIVQHNSVRRGGSLKTTAIFTRVKAGLKSPYYELPMSIKLRLEGNWTSTLMYGKSTFDFSIGNRNYTQEGDTLSLGNHANVGARAQWNVGEVKAETNAKAYVSIQKSDVRDEGSYGIEINAYELSNLFKYDLNTSYDVAYKNRIIKRPITTTMSNSVILRSKDGKGYYEVGYTDKLLGEEPPTWLPEGRKNVFFGLKYKLPFGAGVSLDYVRYIESGDDLFLAKIEYKF